MLKSDALAATDSGRPPVEPEGAPAPDSARRADGQHVDHWVLPAEERAKGFVRPVRRAYRHVGPPGPRHALRDTDELCRLIRDTRLSVKSWDRQKRGIR